MKLLQHIEEDSTKDRNLIHLTPLPPQTALILETFPAQSVAT